MKMKHAVPYVTSPVGEQGIHRTIAHSKAVEMLPAPLGVDNLDTHTHAIVHAGITYPPSHV